MGESESCCSLCGGRSRFKARLLRVFQGELGSEVGGEEIDLGGARTKAKDDDSCKLDQMLDGLGGVVWSGI